MDTFLHTYVLTYAPAHIQAHTFMCMHMQRPGRERVCPSPVCGHIEGTTNEEQLDRLIGTLISNFQYSKTVVSMFLWSMTFLIVVTKCLTNTMWEGRSSPGKWPTVAEARDS